jgi:carbohydrate diacid regulator
LDARIKSAILDTAQALEVEMSLLDEMGNIIVSSSEMEIGTNDNQLESIGFDSDTGAGQSEDGTKSYFYIDSENYKPMYLVISGGLQETQKFGYLTSELLREILKTSVKRSGREELFRALLMDSYEPVELQDAIKDFNLDPDSQNCVILVQTFESDATVAYDAMVKIFPRSTNDVVTMLNRYVIVLVKRMEPEDDMDGIIQLVQAVDDTLSNELSIGAYIGIGSVKRGLTNIKDSFSEAQEAINLGIMQQSRGRVFMFQKLLLERFLQSVPREIRRHFHELSYTEGMKKLMTDEMLETTTRFFENNLNLSETARKLYIHRNTLIYRLEKIQKALGLDLRTFDDAVLLKIMIMLGKSLSSTNRIE